MVEVRVADSVDSSVTDEQLTAFIEQFWELEVKCREHFKEPKQQQDCQPLVASCSSFSPAGEVFYQKERLPEIQGEDADRGIRTC